ncbi:WecB/TagA/CpsF family glycosyltransferase [Bacillus spizizenii]|uniref:WecB/TagA/CpsF family glycosyltransferase n=1 Tax=Bacillus spizizenii TaxID=96241 RepID=UPI0022830A03|nr:WecB/TagA/CpsF family glycosyltransferase [Bacillus spizizenii]MCY7877431.1 WecB/TagA/CpsF family glycosyltransferase [Bacillus spizizenii]MEC0599256.1 WecB/TagA/CpsF family glycosyltransferase [Bacillus spizizenii]MEC1586074.1 WecB/TagA/CpsF family glycosyltransferase [Bacillus spizizenii]
MQTKSINHLDFVDSDLPSFLSHLETSYIDKSKGAFIVTANPEIGYSAMCDSSYKQVISSADFILPDGIGVVMVSRLINKKLQSRIAGYDLFVTLLQQAEKKHKRVYFYGASDKVVKATAARVSQQYPNIVIAGYSNGYVQDKKKIALDIAKTKPDMVFVALGFPNQENFISQYRHLFPQAVCVGLGGSFDVFSGKVKRAPEFFIKLNLEWFYRILTNPSRLKRALSIPKYMLAVFKQERLFNKPDYSNQIKDETSNL